MEDRNQFIEKFRGEPIGTITEQSSVDEIFQNKTLRPILKLQNDLFIEVVKNQIHKEINFECNTDFTIHFEYGKWMIECKYL